MPEACFLEEAAQERERVGLPKERVFATKIALGWQMIKRVKAAGLPFDALTCDDLYGRSHSFRSEMNQAGIVYMADVPANTRVAPAPFEREADLIWSVSELAHAQTTLFQQVQVRPTERGMLCEDFAAVRVFTWRDTQASEEWLVVRRLADQSLSYSLCNAPPDTPLSRLAWLKCVRHFVERANQDAKSESVGMNCRRRSIALGNTTWL